MDPDLRPRTDTRRRWRRARKRAKRWTIYACLRLVGWLLARLPLPVGLFMGRVLGRVAHAVDFAGASRARRQLRRALLVDAKEARALSARVYENVGMIAVEIALLDRLRPILDSYVKLEDDARRVLTVAQAEGHGVLFVTGHLGNWELLAQRIASLGFPSASLARKAPNPFLGAWLVRQRDRGGLATINRGDRSAPRQILSILRKGGILGVLMDQDLRTHSVHVPFFGELASTPTVAADLAVRRGLPVIVGFIRRRADFGHELRLERFVVASSDERSVEARITDVTRALTLRIEEAIRERPAEWVWFHDRWRTRPDSSTACPSQP